MDDGGAGWGDEVWKDDDKAAPPPDNADTNDEQINV